MAEKRWYNTDWTEEITIIVLGVIAIASIFIIEGNEIPIGIGSGLVGYLKGMKRINGNEPS